MEKKNPNDPTLRMKPFQIGVVMGNPYHKVDGSMRIQFLTQREISPEEYTQVRDYMGLTGWMLFSPNREITENDIPSEDVKVEGKSPSQRMRGKIWALWKVKHDQGLTKLDSEEFYRHMMDDLLGKVDNLIKKVENQ